MCAHNYILKVCLLGDDHVIVDEEEPPFPPELTHEVNALYNYEHLTCKLIKIQLSHSCMVNCIRRLSPHSDGGVWRR